MASTAESRRLEEMASGSVEQIGPSLRLAMERGWIGLLPGVLEDYTRQKEREIEKICERSYEGYLDSVQELVKIKSESGGLREHLTALQTSVHAEGHSVLKKTRHLHTLCDRGEKVSFVLDLLTNCQELVKLAQRATAQHNSGKYLSVVSTLALMDSKLYQGVTMQYVRETSIGRRLCEFVPRLRDQLRRRTRGEVRTWLMTVMEKGMGVGYVATTRFFDIVEDQQRQAQVMTTGDGGGWFVPGDGKRAAVSSGRVLRCTEIEEASGLGVWNSARLHSAFFMVEVDKADAARRAALKRRARPGAREQGNSHGSVEDEAEEVETEVTRNLAAWAMRDLSVSLRAIHDALLVHSDNRERLVAFRNFYCSNRRPQLSMDALMGGSTDSLTMRELGVKMLEVCYAIAGFFIIESTLIRTVEPTHAAGLWTLKDLDQLWLDSTKQLMEAVKQCFERSKHNCNRDDVHWALVVKESLGNLCDVLGPSAYQFTVGPLLADLANLQEAFSAMQMHSLSADCDAAISMDANQALQVHDEEMYASYIEPFSLENLPSDANAAREEEDPLAHLNLEDYGTPMVRGLGSRGSPSSSPPSRGGNLPGGRGEGGGASAKRRYPVTFSFSLAVPKCMQYIHEFAVLSMLFGDGVPQEGGDDTLHQRTSAAAMCIEGIIRGKIVNAVRDDLSIGQAAQLSLDSRVFAQLTNRVAGVIDHLAICTSAGRSSTSMTFVPAAAASTSEAVFAPAKRALEQSAESAQDLIFELIRHKIDELLPVGEGSSMVWEPTTPQSTPRSEIDDLVAYLGATLMCLTFLPSTIREAAHFATCTHVHNRLQTALLECKRVNVLALHGLRLDLAALEAFADGSGIPDLALCFAPLKDLMNALLDKDARTLFADPELRHGSYPRLDITSGIAVLDKVNGLSMVAKISLGTKLDIPMLDRKQAAELSKLLSMEL